MPTPRPLGVRRAKVNEEQFVKHLTSRSYAPRIESLRLVGFGALQRAPHHIALASKPDLVPFSGLLIWLGQRHIPATVRRHIVWRGLYSSPPSWRAASNISSF